MEEQDACEDGRRGMQGKEPRGLLEAGKGCLQKEHLSFIPKDTVQNLQKYKAINLWIFFFNLLNSWEYVTAAHGNLTQAQTNFNQLSSKFNPDVFFLFLWNWALNSGSIT
jgi:hypothetical protein